MEGLKTMIKFDDIQNAFLFVSSAAYGMNSAVVRKDTGEILYRSEMSGEDEIGEKNLDPDHWVAIPHRNALDLDQSLVLEFVKANLPDQYDAVRQIFKKRGAYGRFKEFLDSKGRLERWHKYSDQREEMALRKWCEENGIDLSDHT
jgi:hypothetical protein